MQTHLLSRRAIRAVSTMAATLLLGACGGGGGDGDGTGVVSFAITDAPVDDASAVVVYMTGLRLKPADGPAFDVTGFTPRAVNLLDLQNGASEDLIREETVPAGEYNWIRIGYDESLSYVELEEGGGQYPLRIPSGDKTGLKLVSGFTVPVNGTADYMIDFDVRKAVTRPSGVRWTDPQQVFFLKPAHRIMNIDGTGDVFGVVAQDLIDQFNDRCDPAASIPNGGNAVYVFDGFDADIDDEGDPEDDGRPSPVTSDRVELNTDTGDYEYTIAYLLAGDYTFAFTCSAQADETGDADYPADPEGLFDFDATINVSVARGDSKRCDMPATDSQPDPC